MDPFQQEKKIFKKRRRRKKWKKERNYLLNSLPKTERLLYTANIYGSQGLKKRLTIPKHFSTSIDIESVLEFVAKCKSLALTRNVLISFNFKKVEKVNAGALALLLSVIQDLTDLKIRIEGNLPIAHEARREFIDSGFLEYFYDRKGRRAACKNKILVQGHDKTKQIETAHEIQKAMQTVFGVQKFNPPIQGAIIEMMANSVNHAFPNLGDKENLFYERFLENKRWYLSISHNQENNTVHFSFIDNGIGILQTLKRGIFSKAVDKLNSTQILKNAFDGKYRSSTKRSERGHGLPTIKEAFDKNAVTGLKVVTNDYEYSFDNESGTKLTNGFEGTVYFWSVDATCNNGIIKDK